MTASLVGRFRAVAIGHTGRGHDGHHSDTRLADIEAVGPVAVADPHAAGR